MKNGFDVSIFIVTSDNQYIPDSEYRESDDGEGIFVMLTNDELDPEFGDDNSITIHKDYPELLDDAKKFFPESVEFKDMDDFVLCAWQNDEKEIPGTFKLNRSTDEIGDYGSLKRDRCAMRYLNGYGYNRTLISNVSKALDGIHIEEYIPAVMLAYHTTVFFNGCMCHGYLPQIGQLIYMSMNINVLNRTLRKIRGQHTYASGLNHDVVWQSVMEHSDYGIWVISDDGHTGIHPKVDMCCVLPLFML